MTMKLRTKRKRSIGTLPDGNHAYLDSLRDFINWLAAQEEFTREKFIVWLRSQRGLKEKSAANYWQVIVMLGFIANSGSSVGLTEFANEFLRCDDSAQAELLFKKLYTVVDGIQEIMAFYHQSPTESFHLMHIIEELSIKEANLSTTNVERKVHWLASLGVLQQTLPRTYRITSFGSRLIAQYPEQTQPIRLQITAEEIVRELRLAVRDSENYRRFEIALAVAFKFIGFKVTLLSGSGNSDLLIEVMLDELGYSSIVDGKTNKDGKLTDFNPDRILKHKAKHKANYAIIIAESFSDGELVTIAEERGMTLMNLDVICDWVKFHKDSPLNLVSYREFFSQPGWMRKIPNSIAEKHFEITERRKTLRLLVSMIWSQSNLGVYLDEAPEPLRNALSIVGKKSYSKELIEAIIDFLRNPLIDAAIRNNDSMRLAMNESSLVLLFEALAEMFREN